MQNSQQPSTGGQFELNKQRLLETTLFPNEQTEEQQLLERLLETGFDSIEASKLIHLREHLYENSEVRQRVAEDSRMHFVRWLYEHGEIGED